MKQNKEGFFTSFDEARLFYIHIEAPQNRANIVLTHGQSEHSGPYHRLFSALEELPVSIYTWDLRGHGRSQGQRGYVLNFDEYLNDMKSYIDYLSAAHDLFSKPVILIGHSMGGLIQEKTLLQNMGWSITAQVLSGPWLGLSVEVPLIKDLGAIAIHKVFPRLTLSNSLNYFDLTSDLQVIEEFKKDPLRHSKISAGAYLGGQTVSLEVKAAAHEIKIPTLMQISSKDPIVSSPACREFFKNLGSSDKSLIEYPDFGHEIYNEVKRAEVFADLKAFLTRFI